MKNTNLKRESNKPASVNYMMLDGILRILKDCKKTREYQENKENFEICLSIIDEFIMPLNISHNFENKKIYTLKFVKLPDNNNITKYSITLYELVEKIEESLDFYIRNNFLKIEFDKLTYSVSDCVPLEDVFNCIFIQSSILEQVRINDKFYLKTVSDNTDNFSSEKSTPYKLNNKNNINNSVIIFIDYNKINKFNFFIIYDYLKSKKFYIHIFFFSKDPKKTTQGPETPNINSLNNFDFNEVNDYLKKFVFDDEVLSDLLSLHMVTDFENFNKYFQFEMTKENTIYLLDSKFQIIQIYERFMYSEIFTDILREEIKQYNLDENLFLLNNISDINDDDMNTGLLKLEEKVVDALHRKTVESKFYDSVMTYDNDFFNTADITKPIDRFEYKKIKKYIKIYNSKHSLKDYKPVHFLEIKMKKMYMLNQDFETFKKDYSIINFFYCINNKFKIYLNDFWSYFRYEKLDHLVSNEGCIVHYKFFIDHFIEKIKSKNLLKITKNFFKISAHYLINYNYAKCNSNGIKELIIENRNHKISEFIINNKINLNLYKETKHQFKEIIKKSGYPLKINLKLFPILGVSHEFLIFDEKMKILKYEKSPIYITFVIKLTKVFYLEKQFFEFLKLIKSYQVLIITLGEPSKHKILINNYYKEFTKFRNVDYMNINYVPNNKELLYSLYDLKNNNAPESKNLNHLKNISIFLVKNKIVVSKTHELYDKIMIFNLEHIQNEELLLNQTLFKKNLIDNSIIEFKQIKSSIKNLKRMIDSQIQFVSKCKYDFNLKVTFKFNDFLVMNIPIISKPRISIKIHEYDINLISTALEETAFLIMERKNYIVNVMAKMKNLETQKEGYPNKLIYIDSKGKKKGYQIIQNLVSYKQEESKPCCDQCLIF